MKRAKCFLFLVSSMLLVGCANNPPNVSTSTETSEDKTTTTTTTEYVPPTFSNEQFKDLSGKYFGHNNVVNVTNEKTVIEGDLNLNLIPTKLEVKTVNISEDKTADITYVYYESIINPSTYCLHLSEDEKQVLVLEELKDGEYNELLTFMPSIEFMAGCYSFDGSGDPFNLVLTFGDYYDSNIDAFTVGYGYTTGLFTTTYYAKTYKTVVNEKMEVMMDIYDFDEYLFYSFVAKNTENSIYLYDYSWSEEPSYVSDPAFMNTSLFTTKSESLITSIDTANKNITFNTSEAVKYDMVVRKDGSFIKTTYLNEEVFLQSTPYGVIFETNGVKEHYVFDDASGLNGEYKYRDITFNFDSVSETLTINEKTQDFTYVIYDNHKGIKTEINGNDAYFRANTLDVSIKANLNGEVVYFLNESAYLDKFNNSFVYINNNETDSIEIDENLNVKYLTKEVKGYFVYTPTLKNPYVEFEVDNVTYQFMILQENIGSYILKQGDKTTPFFIKTLVESTYDQYTSHHQVEIVYNEEGLTYKGQKVDYSIEPYYVEYYFTYTYAMKFTLDNKTHILQFGLNGLINEYIVANEEDVFETSYVNYDVYLDLIGTYTFNGKFGPESFTLTDDGHFYADTANESGDGLDYNVEYDYNLSLRANSDGTSTPVIAFYYPKLDTTIYLYKEGHSLLAFNLKYVADYIFKYQGVYYDNTMSHAVYLVDDVLYVDGAKAEVSDIEHNNETTTFTCTVDNKTTVVTFTTNEGVKSVTLTQDELTFTANHYDFNIELFVGSYTYNDKTYEFKKVVDPLTQLSKYAFSDGFMNYDYVVCAYNGHVCIKISIFFDTFYLYLDGDVVKMDVVNGMLPPPPPPPLP